jgi:hypothetical protein
MNDSWSAFVAAIAAVAPGVRVERNRNRRTLLVLRRADDGVLTLSVHAGLLAHVACVAELPGWLTSNGRGRFPGIRAALRAVANEENTQRAAAARAELPPLETLAGPFDLIETFGRLHARWFAHISLPRVAWGRGVAPGRALHHIRFGCYRPGRQPLVTLHPRLDQPWVARVFVEHVLFHELCHHCQACRPVPGETAHSARFRSWEHRYPHHADALAWEKAYLPHLMDGTLPAHAERT